MVHEEETISKPADSNLNQRNQYRLLASKHNRIPSPTCNSARMGHGCAISWNHWPNPWAYQNPMNGPSKTQNYVRLKRLWFTIIQLDALLLGRPTIIKAKIAMYSLSPVRNITGQFVIFNPTTLNLALALFLPWRDKIVNGQTTELLGVVCIPTG